MCAVFKLKYPTTCAECGKQLEVGEEVKGRVTRREDGSKKWFITCKEHIPQLPQIELVQIDTTPTHVTIYCDGACEPYNPGGAAAWGFVAYVTSTEQPIHYAFGVVKVGNGATNNLAEFAAVVAALMWVKEQGIRSVKIYTDSQLVVKLLNRQWKPSSNEVGYYDAYKNAREVLTFLRRRKHKVTIEWIPRDWNKVADALSNYAAYYAYKEHEEQQQCVEQGCVRQSSRQSIAHSNHTLTEVKLRC